jgi:hypothetical protein
VEAAAACYRHRGGKLFAIGTRRMNANLQAYGNIVKPDIGPDWTLRFTLQ